MKKVALIGNMNNNFYSLARYFKEDPAIAVTLFLLNNEQEHFKPENDIFSANTIKTEVLEWGDEHFFLKTPPKKVRNDLKEFDKIIACGHSVAFLSRAKVTIDIFIPYGSDMVVLPFLEHSTNPIYFVVRSIFSLYQKRGIRNARHVFFERTNDAFEGPFHRIKPKGKRENHGIPLVFSKDFNPKKINEYKTLSRFWKVFEALRNENQIVVFHHSRHFWKSKNRDGVSHKGNDRLIRGFANFLNKEKGSSAALLLFEYGPDVNASKVLIRELGIESSVHWMPLMPRKEILVGIHFSDAVVGELEQSWFSYGIVHEALAMAKPLIHHRIDSLYEGYYPDLYPMLEARSEEDISDILAELQQNPEKFKKIGTKGYDWFKKNFVDRTMSKIYEALDMNYIPNRWRA